MTTAVITELDPRPVDFSTVKFTAEQFERVCEANPDRSFELTAQGVLEVVPPVGVESGNYESELLGDLVIWNRQTRLGKTFSSSTVFTLPNGSKRSPDAAWVELSRWEAVSREERKKFARLVPDFSIELRSETDRIPPLQAKMAEYRDNGVRLGWLINPQDRQVEIYRFEREASTERLALSEVVGVASPSGEVSRNVEVLAAPMTLSGEDVLPGFTLDLSPIWA